MPPQSARNDCLCNLVNSEPPTFITLYLIQQQQQQQKDFHNTIIILVGPNRSRALYDAITIASISAIPKCWATLFTMLLVADKKIALVVVVVIQREGDHECHSKTEDKYMNCNRFEIAAIKSGIRFWWDYKFVRPQNLWSFTSKCPKSGTFNCPETLRWHNKTEKKLIVGSGRFRFAHEE